MITPLKTTVPLAVAVKEPENIGVASVCGVAVGLVGGGQEHTNNRASHVVTKSSPFSDRAPVPRRVLDDEEGLDEEGSPLKECFPTRRDPMRRQVHRTRRLPPATRGREIVWFVLAEEGSRTQRRSIGMYGH
jgi:hypothetical protein